MLSIELLGVLAFIGILILFFGGRRRPRKTTAPVDRMPKNAILVDGSNVMHWGDGASVKTLVRVLRSLEQKGYAPVVFFDANVGYVLDDHYYNEAKLAKLLTVPEQHICVVGKGVVADEAILSCATAFGLRIVTNDGYRDWRVAFPHANKKGVLVRGTWRDGSVVWRGKL